MNPYIRLTYPASWIKQYLTMNYVDLDPVLKEGFTRTLPSTGRSSGRERGPGAFLMDALAHGVGPEADLDPGTQQAGASRPVLDLLRPLPEEWQAFKERHLDDAVTIAHRIHQRVISEVFGEDRPHLTDREVECLRLTAIGKDAGDIALILGISPHTARDYLQVRPLQARLRHLRPGGDQGGPPRPPGDLTPLRF